MTYYVSRVTGDVDVLPDAFAVDDAGDSLRFLSVRGEHSGEIADVVNCTIVGVAMTIADDGEVLVTHAGSPQHGMRGRVRSLSNPGSRRSFARVRDACRVLGRVDRSLVSLAGFDAAGDRGLLGVMKTVCKLRVLALHGPAPPAW